MPFVMRRPAFVIVIIIIVIIVVLESLDVPLQKEKFEAVFGVKDTYLGRIENIEFREDYTRFEIRILNSCAKSFENEIKASALITIYSSNDMQDISQNYEKYGELLYYTVAFETELDYAERARNPHCFDYYMYLKSRNIGAIGTTKEFSIVNTELSPIRKFEKMLFDKKILFGEHLSDNSKGIIMGMAFGDKTYLSDEIYSDFRENGTAHILSVSGLHIGMLYSLYLMIFGKKQDNIKLVLLIIIMLSYGILSNWSASVVRAEMMIALKIIADRLYLRYDLLNALSIVAIIMIAFNPYVIYAASFQMSFLAIVSISFLAPVFKDRIGKLILSSFVVNLGLLFYQMYAFNYISFTAIFANIPIVFLASIQVPLIMICFVCFCFNNCFGLNSLFSAIPFKNVLDLISDIIVKVNNLSTIGGKGGIEVPSPNMGITIAAIALMIFFTSEYYYVYSKRNEYRKLAALVLIIVLSASGCSVLFKSQITNDDLVFVDVGQGDCIHINYGNTDILIDGGGKYSYNVGEKILKQYLLKNGNKDIDLAITTHEHMDHKKGIDELCASSFKVKNTYNSCKEGDNRFISDELYIRTLWPITIDEKEGQDENENCSVFMIYYKGYRILITGDLDTEGEMKLLNHYNGGELKADILKVGHHGSKTSTSDELLKAVDPQYAVIQVGKNNYGHPSKEIIEKLNDSGIMIFSTLESGAIGFRLKKDGIEVHEMISK